MSETTDPLRLTAHREEEGQRLEAELELAVEPRAVWAALTDAQELMNWFPLQAEVEEGEGGRIHMSWDGSWDSDLEIQCWEPERRLRTSWPWTDEDGLRGEPNAVVVDYRIEPRSGGGTLLRLVHSGFPVGEEWEDIFDGTRRGWSYELRSLKHYLENHRGVQRAVARVRRSMGGRTNREVWERLWAPGGLVVEGAIGRLERGASYAFTMPGGIELAGKILVAIAPTDLGATVRGVNNSLFRVAVGHECGPEEPPEIQLWLATWGALREQVEKIEAAWEAALDRVLAT